MPADEVLVRSIEPGRSEVTVDGWRVPGVRSVQVTKAVNNVDVVTIELRAHRVTVLPLAAEHLDSEGRPPGHPAYCAEGCIHVDDTGRG